jgi:hypothetical protein
MFYLKHFFKIITKSPLRGFFLFFLSILMVFSLGQRPFLEEQFMKMIPENKAGAYFYALISSTESYQTIASQMGALPGVHKVEILSEAQIKEEVKNIMGNLQVEIKDGLIDLNYVGLKIIYARDLKPRAQELVRDYLTHLAGEGNITLGAVKTADQTFEKKNQLITTIKQWGYSLYLIVVLTFWFIAILSLRTKIAETSYLLESYQRKRKIALKMAIVGLTVIFLIATSTTFILGIPKVLNMVIALVLFIVGILLHNKRYTWDH